MINLYRFFLIGVKWCYKVLVSYMHGNYFECVDTDIKRCINRAGLIGVGGSCKGNPVVRRAKGQRPSKSPSGAKQGRRTADD